MELLTISITDPSELATLKELASKKLGKKKLVGVFKIGEKCFMLVLDKLAAAITFLKTEDLKEYLEKNLYEVNLEKKSLKKTSKSVVEKNFEDMVWNSLILLLIKMKDGKIARISVGNDVCKLISIEISRSEYGIKIENKELLENLIKQES
jgi:hypothetical protein